MRTHPVSRLTALAVCLTLALGLVPGAARAQTTLKGPVTLVVPFPPGGLGDLTARRLSTGVTDIIKQPVLVDYKPGGGGGIGATYVKTQAADGTVLLIANSSIMAINPFLMAKVGYDAMKDFAPVSMLVSTSHILLVPKDSRFKTFADVVAYAKAKTGPLTFASAGVGGGGHLLGEMLKQKTGGDLVHVPYKGAAQAMQDVLGGRIDLYFESVALAASQVQAGNVRALAVTSQKRMTAYPDIPSLNELGYGDIFADSWFALFAPAGTPAPVVEALNAAFVRTLHDPEVVRPLTDQGLDLLPGTPQDLAATLQKDSERYRKLIVDIGAKLE